MCTNFTCFTAADFSVRAAALGGGGGGGGGATRGGAGHLGLTHTETQRGRLWTACAQRCVDRKTSQTTSATTSTTSIRQLLGATEAEISERQQSSKTDNREIFEPLGGGGGGAYCRVQLLGAQGDTKDPFFNTAMCTKHPRCVQF